MAIGVLQVELEIDDALSLKDKRRIVNSLKDRLHHEHMVSVAETASQDNPRLATLGIVLAASDARYAQSVLQRILNKLQQHRDCVLSDHDLRVLTGDTPGYNPGATPGDSASEPQSPDDPDDENDEPSH